ncbi:cysteine-rich PDZ-binding protein-like [Antedon mediterranea]|uniref:cysteine-rich PDZ-binding protein-like n=1 Tax=Antedon mediterranea TaxID=105859 RepID=UPI003AF41368
MVCEKCQKKLGRIATPDPWKAKGASSSSGGGKMTSCGRKLGENKLLTASKSKYSPYNKSFVKCRICKQSVHQVGSHYCQGCAYKKGICAMCGKKILDTKNYKQTSV